MSSGPAASALEPSRENNAPSVDESALVATINSPISSWLDQAIFAQHRSVPLFRVPRSPDAIKAYKNSYAASVILSLTTGARVKRFSPTPFPGRLRFCRSAIALSQEGFCVFDQSPVFSQSGGGRKVSPLISSASSATIAASNSPLFGEAGGLLKRSADASATG